MVHAASVGTEGRSSVCTKRSRAHMRSHNKPSNVEGDRLCLLPRKDTLKASEGHESRMGVDGSSANMSFSKQQQPTNNLPEMKPNDTIVYPVPSMGSHITKQTQHGVDRNLVEELKAEDSDPWGSQSCRQ